MWRPTTVVSTVPYVCLGLNNFCRLQFLWWFVVTCDLETTIYESPVSPSVSLSLFLESKIWKMEESKKLEEKRMSLQIRIYLTYVRRTLQNVLYRCHTLCVAKIKNRKSQSIRSMNNPATTERRERQKIVMYSLTDRNLWRRVLTSIYSVKWEPTPSASEI